MSEQTFTETLVKSGWLEPSIIVPAIAVIIASGIVPILLHFLRGRRENNARIFEIRKEVYTKYFQKYEDAAEGVGNDYEEFSQVTLKEEFKKLLESDNSPNAIIAFQEAVGEFPQKIQNAHRKATEETTAIKLIGSQKLFDLTSEFERLNQEILEMSSQWLAEMQETLSQPDLEKPVAIEMKRKGKKAKQLKEEIIWQMRRELGLHD